MQYKLLILLLLFILSNGTSQDYYYNKIIDVREGQAERCSEIENHENFLYTRSAESDTETGEFYTRISKFNLEGNLINSVIFDSLYTFQLALRNMEFLEDTLLILGNNSAEKQIAIQYCSTNLEDLGRLEYTIYVEGSGIFVNYLLQNENYFFAVGHVYFNDDEFPIKDSEGIIIRIDKNTMDVDSTFSYTRGTTDFIFARPQVDEFGNLSVSFIESTDNDGILGNQYGVIKYDENLNELWAFDIPFHNETDATAHHYEFDNGNIVFTDQGRDSLIFSASSAAALHCTNTNGTQIWRRQEYIISNEVISDVTRYYSEGLINQEGNLVLASYYFDPYIITEARLICVSPSGELLWERLYDSPSPDWESSAAEIAGLTELENGDIVIYGYQLQTLPNTNHWLIKVNSFGCLEPGCELTATEDVKKEKYNISVSPTLVQKNTSIVVKANMAAEVQEVDLMLYSVNGNLMQTESIYLSNTESRVDLSSLPIGSYFLVLSNKGNVLHTEKIVIVE